MIKLFLYFACNIYLDFAKYIVYLSDYKKTFLSNFFKLFLSNENIQVEIHRNNSKAFHDNC